MKVFMKIFNSNLRELYFNHIYNFIYLTIMTQKYFLVLILLSFIACHTAPPADVSKPAAENTEAKQVEKTLFRAAYTRKTDLIHTRLNVSLNFRKKELTGQAAIILRPHFYPTDSVILNAKGMELKEVSLMKFSKRIKLNFSYDSLLIRIKLDRKYSRDELFTLYIDYISRPNNIDAKGSQAIAETRGLYFINADGTDKFSPTQAWTQGETESNSVWFPTIEDPQQKMTQEIYITVDSSMKTLSNGLLLSSSVNTDGTRTDYWKQSLPAAPYLTMIAAGNFSIVKDTWKNIEVNYYVDPPYEKYAKLFFGKTPEMMTFFSDLLGVQFAWEKYSQIVVHDYISGAMENTTATVFGTNLQKDPREYIDDNSEEYIAHELFHHWFGDLVTCESWSNVTLNEGFANYAEYLWDEHEYGRETADYNAYLDQNVYLYSAAEADPPLIRFHYDNREDLYDAISYNKGGKTLHMLRNYVGDEAFFQTLHKYLSTHMFGTAEIEDLRIAFEETTGEDLHWFFDQWFMKGGHPELKIDYGWSDSLKTQTVSIKQIQNKDKAPVYRLPIAIDLYYSGKVERKNVVIEEAEQKFVFDLPAEPDLVNVEARKILVCTKSDNKTSKQLVFQYDHAPLVIDRLEAVNKIGKSYTKSTPEAGVIIRALNDSFYGVRIAALNNISELALNAPDSVKQAIIRLASKDPVSSVRDKALSKLAQYYSYKENEQIFVNALLYDSSYRVNGRALAVLGEKDANRADQYAINLEKDSSSIVLLRLCEYFNNSKTDKIYLYKRAYAYCDAGDKYRVTAAFEEYLKKQAPDVMLNGINLLTEQARKPQVTWVKTEILNTLNEIEKSIDQRISTLENSLEKTERNKMDVQSEITQLRSIRVSLHGEIAQLEKSE
jgi:aminopeptidase N